MNEEEAPEIEDAPVVSTADSSLFTKSDLKTLAFAQNPAIGYFDPLNLAEQMFWPDAMEDSSEEEVNAATIGFLRHAEMKHGRVAMAGFVGYCAHANGFVLSGPMTLKGETFAEIAAKGDGSPGAIWDATPEGAKWQIITFVGLLEFASELSIILEANGAKHYMRGGKPGYFPPLSVPTEDGKRSGLPLPLYDPFGWTKKLSEEDKARKLNIEINNGRLAMIGLFGFLAESKAPGSVPFLTGLIQPYDGDYMAPFASDFSLIN